MDVNTVYGRLSDLVAQFRVLDGDPDVREALDLAYGLDAHLRGGGQLPAPWLSVRN